MVRVHILLTCRQPALEDSLPPAGQQIGGEGKDLALLQPVIHPVPGGQPAVGGDYVTDGIILSV